MKKEYKLALVGATGVVGRVARKILEEKDLPISEYAFFSSYKSAGSKITFKGKEYTVRELKEDSFDEGFDYAIFSAGGDTSKKFSPIAASKGCIVVDNSNAWRMDKEVPLVVPEVNSEEIKKNKGIIANPNCSTIQAVVPLKVLDDKCFLPQIKDSKNKLLDTISKRLNELCGEDTPKIIKKRVNEELYGRDKSNKYGIIVF